MQTPDALGINQWYKTSKAIEWFTNIKNKKECIFIQFYICDFYASIIENM